MKKKWLYVAICCFLFSCAHVEQAKETKSEPVRPPEIPSPLSFQVEKEKKAVKIREEETLSFALRDAEVKDILRAIGKQAGYNVVLEPDVKGSSTVDLKNVTLGKALQYLLEPLGFTYKIEDKTIYVSKPKVETKIFHLNYLALKKVGSSTVYTTPGTVGGSTTAGGGAVTTTSTSGSQVTVKSETDSDLWKSLEDNIKSLVSRDGKFIVNKQTMMIFVTDYPNSLRDIETFLKAAEDAIQRQVMIEAKIIEVQLNDESRQGINWSFINAKIGELTLGGKQVFFNTLPDATLSTTSAIANVPYFRISGSQNDVSGFLDLLRVYGKVEIISNPKISAMNNQRAIIKVARQDVYFDVTQTNNSSIIGEPTITYTARFVDVGLTLDVMAQIDDRSNIILNVHPIMSEKVDNIATPGDLSTVPLLDVREVDTMVKVKEGETIVIGGLIKKRKKNTDTGAKGLMNVPLIGQLFKLNETEDSKNELVVILTPRVIYGERGL